MKQKHTLREQFTVAGSRCTAVHGVEYAPNRPDLVIGLGVHRGGQKSGDGLNQLLHGILIGGVEPGGHKRKGI